MSSATKCPRDYGGLQWSSEILDCSLPLRLDTYSVCSYNCVYCFSYFQRAVGPNSEGYRQRKVRSVNPDKLRRALAGTHHPGPIADWFAARRPIQWGGLSDQFDEYERRYGVSLELMQLLHARQYPVSYSTKAVWWTEDERYWELVDSAPFWHFKVSLVTLDEMRAGQIERGVPPPAERLEAIRRLAGSGANEVGLRLRPFIPGLTDKTFEALIGEASAAGAKFVSTEFLCLETRCRPERFQPLSEAVGFDLVAFYRQKSLSKAGYLRLNPEYKRPYIDKVEELCRRYHMRLYVSDSHFKGRSCNACCCGVAESAPGGLGTYWRGHYAHALQIAKREGRVRFSDILELMGKWRTPILRNLGGINLGSTHNSAVCGTMPLESWYRYYWNKTSSAKSPYRYFHGALWPVGVDENKDVIYEYRPL